ncbi:hypothetical protein WG66_013355 [Moniliophthora roreri]|uniref:Uncharacterized protein n=1 Tax=Moniliophthora roreri TaxID=221103 RepID=A0A0W0FVI7_MONRR|nr:hypothetical protein WG66_013355 [Moniliophthora roreri]
MEDSKGSQWPKDAPALRPDDLPTKRLGGEKVAFFGSDATAETASSLRSKRRVSTPGIYKMIELNRETLWIIIIRYILNIGHDCVPRADRPRCPSFVFVGKGRLGQLLSRARDVDSRRLFHGNVQSQTIWVYRKRRGRQLSV